MVKTSSNFCSRLVIGCVIAWSVCRLPGVAAGREEYPGESVQWQRYQSPHFELFSANREKESRALLHNLELLRALFMDGFKLKERQPQEVTVYYFKDRQAFKAYAPASQQQEVAGYYLYQPDRAVLAVSPVWSDQRQRPVVFHEFIHHLNRMTGAAPPLWYNEGVAELYSTIEVKADQVILGKHLPWYVTVLRAKELLPLETLFEIDPTSPVYNSSKHSGLFYAESWALMHYVRFGKSRLDKAKFELFLRYVLEEENGGDPVKQRAVFKELLGMDYADLEEQLESYVAAGRFVYQRAPVPQIPGAETYLRRGVPREEISERLAELSFRVNQSAKARLTLLQAAEKPNADARCWEVLGSEAWRQDDPDTAQEFWHRAVGAGSNNPAIFHELGQREGQRWFAHFDYNFLLSEERAQQLRTWLKRSIRSAPDQSASYETLAWVEASVSKPDGTNLNLVQEHLTGLRQKARTVLALAMVQARSADRVAALQRLDQVDRLNPDFWTASAAENLRAKLEERSARIIPSPPPAPVRAPRLRLPLTEFLK